MRRVCIEIDIMEHIDHRDFHEWRKDVANEVLDDLCRAKGPVEIGVLGDLIDARAALLTRRYDEALRLLDRALDDWRFAL